MGQRFPISAIHGLAFLLIPTLALAQPVSVTSSVAKKVRYTTTLPTTCVVGEIYADSNATSGQQFYICETANNWVLQGDGGGTAVGWTDDGGEVRLDTSTDEVEIGSAATLSAKFAINGDTDEIQSLVQGNATQTSNIFVYERSDGTDVMTGSTTGVLISQNFAVSTLVGCDTIDTNSAGIFRCGNDGGSGAPTDADYLVGTANGSLSAEIVVGTTPGGELGNTWASPTLDDSVTVTGWVMGASTATTPAIDDNDTSLATTAFVNAEIDDDLDASSELLALVDDETGTGVLVFGTSPNFTTDIGFANSADDDVLAAAGDSALNTTDEQLSFHSAADGEISGEASISLIRHLHVTFDPAGWYDQESTYRVLPLMTVGDDSPEGITITEWEADYVAGDPTTELDADIMCDTTPDYNPAAGATVMDVIDTTTGSSGADTGFDSATCANASKMYIRFGADPVDNNVVIALDIWYFNEED